MKRGVITLVASILLILPMQHGTSADLNLGDIPFQRKIPGADEISPAVFPHWVHRVNFKCYVCHDAIFQMKAGANVVTMDAIQEGKFCGTCHNGKIAFHVGFETCHRCHRE